MLSLPLTAILAAVLGCSQSVGYRTSVENRPASLPRSDTVKIQSEKNGTGVYQFEVKSTGQLRLRRKLVTGKYTIEFTNTANYSGKPACNSESVALSILHASKVRTVWWFPARPKVEFLIDGQVSKPVKSELLPMDKEGDEYIESLIMQPTCDTMTQFAKAQTAEIHISDASIVLSPDDIAAFKAFAAALGLR